LFHKQSHRHTAIELCDTLYTPLPTELVDSKNKKKIDTESNDTIRTDLRGCLDRTLEASSCTQIDIDIRCAMRTSSEANSMSPEILSCALPASLSDVSSLTVVRRNASSLFTMWNEDGNAARITDSARTMPINSSSDRFAWCAASSSSFAIPYDTEKARSEPNELNDAAVVMAPPLRLLFDVPIQDVNALELKMLCQECRVIRHLLAWQEGLTLSIRRLLVCPIVNTDMKGHRGKAVRRRVQGTHLYSYSSCVFGCVLKQLVEFACGNAHSNVSTVMTALRRHLDPAARSLSSCNGMDAAHLKCGFACCTVIQCQMYALPETKRSSGINTRYGKSSVAIGIGAALFFLFSHCASDPKDMGALRQATGFWTDWCVRCLSKWTDSMSLMNTEHMEALEAERRALQRGLHAIHVAKRQTELLHMNLQNSVKLELAFMAKAMWPPHRTLDKVTHPMLCEWIHSEEFLCKADSAHTATSNVTTREHYPTPLSALSECVLSTDSGVVSECESTCDTCSSVGWSGWSGWSGSTLNVDTDNFALDMNALASHFNNSEPKQS